MVKILFKLIIFQPRKTAAISIPTAETAAAATEPGPSEPVAAARGDGSQEMEPFSDHDSWRSEALPLQGASSGVLAHAYFLICALPF